MKPFKLLLLLITLVVKLEAQLYFPPNNSTEWETTAPSTLGWCNDNIDSLYNFLDENHSVAFILLKDGKIVLEKYFGDQTSTSYWYWASAGKSLTSFMVGLAQQEGFLDIDDETSKYLGTGWTSCTPEQENLITVRNQISMSSGLDDMGVDPYCTDDSCLVYLADAGTRWAYHNAPYTLLDQVIANATGTTLNNYVATKVKTPTGMDGFYFMQDYNNVFYSTARSMARYGLLILNHGNWNGNQIMTDTDYFHAMVNTSQNLNKSYGYLWWLNGKDSYMLPQSQFVFPGKLCPDAPDDMISALGKNGQFINVIPSMNMVWIRMGNAPDNMPVPAFLNDSIWKYINELECNSNGFDNKKSFNTIQVFPNPTHDNLILNSQKSLMGYEYIITDPAGKCVQSGIYSGLIPVATLNTGIYFLHISDSKSRFICTFIKQ